LPTAGNELLGRYEALNANFFEIVRGSGGEADIGVLVADFTILTADSATQDFRRFAFSPRPIAQAANLVINRVPV
jgi:hypothetical protein